MRNEMGRKHIKECLFLPKVNAWLLGNNNVRKGRVEGGDVVKQTTLSFTK